MLISIFLIVFMLVMAIIAFGMSLLRGFFNILFGRRSGTNHSESHSQSQQSAPPRKKREKVFDKNDGEYVDFEEIKE